MLSFPRRVVSPTTNPKPEDHNFSAVRAYLFNVFSSACSPHIHGKFPPSATCACATMWLQETRFSEEHPWTSLTDLVLAFQSLVFLCSKNWTFKYLLDEFQRAYRHLNIAVVCLHFWGKIRSCVVPILHVVLHILTTIPYVLHSWQVLTFQNVLNHI